MNDPQQNYTFTPIGTISSPLHHPYDAPRQGTGTGTAAQLELLPGHNYEQALQELELFDRIWLIAVFDRNNNWKPLTAPPGSGNKRVGVFACRSPYRPNPVALSCVELTGIKHRTLHLRGCDLLDGTPVLDIKPYISYADAFPDASTGWKEQVKQIDWQVTLSPPARQQIDWLHRQGVVPLEEFILRELGCEPLNSSRKRLIFQSDGTVLLCYRTWRIRFKTDRSSHSAVVLSIKSGYDRRELSGVQGQQDPYGDKAVHRQFISLFEE